MVFMVIGAILVASALGSLFWMFAEYESVNGFGLEIDVEVGLAKARIVGSYLSSNNFDFDSDICDVVFGSSNCDEYKSKGKAVITLSSLLLIASLPAFGFALAFCLKAPKWGKIGLILELGILIALGIALVTYSSAPTSILGGLFSIQLGPSFYVAVVGGLAYLTAFIIHLSLLTCCDLLPPAGYNSGRYDDLS